MKCRLMDKTVFRKDVRPPNSGGSQFLGYAYLDFAVVDGPHTLQIGMCDVAVRLNRNGEHRLEFPTDVRKDAEGNVVLDDQGQEIRDARYHPGNADTRKVLTLLVFRREDVKLAVAEARNGETAASSVEALVA